VAGFDAEGLRLRRWRRCTSRREGNIFLNAVVAVASVEGGGGLRRGWEAALIYSTFLGL
jgi:hypothetical protein